MRKVTSFVVLAGASALGVCAAQTPATSSGADASPEGVPAAASAGSQTTPVTPQVKSASPQTPSATVQVTLPAQQIRSTSPQITFAAPRTVSAAPPSVSTAAPQDEVLVRGYRRVVTQGHELFCRVDPVLGSRLKKRQVCLTHAQLQAREDNSRRFIERVQQSGILAGPGGPKPLNMSNIAP